MLPPVLVGVGEVVGRVVVPPDPPPPPVVVVGGGVVVVTVVVVVVGGGGAVVVVVVVAVVVVVVVTVAGGVDAPVTGVVTLLPGRPLVIDVPGRRRLGRGAGGDAIGRSAACVVVTACVRASSTDDGAATARWGLRR